MILTRQQLVLDLLAYIGVSGFGVGGGGDDPTDDNDLTKALIAVNAALQLIFDKGPGSIKTDQRSGVLNVPTAIVLNCASNGCVFVSGQESWMEGCSVQIDGDSVMNRIARMSGGVQLVVAGVTTIYNVTTLFNGFVQYNSLGETNPSINSLIHHAATKWSFYDAGSDRIYKQIPGNFAHPWDVPQWLDGGTGDPVSIKVTRYPFLSIAAEVELLRSYSGADGNHAATVYCDSIPLDGSIRAVIEPVELFRNNVRYSKLVPAQSKAMFDRYFQSRSNPPLNFIGTPSTYFVEKRRNVLYLQVAPAPAVAGNVGFGVYLKPERVTLDDLATDGGDDPGTPFESLDDDQIESLLVPIARWKFFVHPSLLNNEQRNSVKTEHDEAIMRLSGGQGISPSVSATRVKYV